jgi:hypothetical protein
MNVENEVRCEGERAVRMKHITEPIAVVGPAGGFRRRDGCLGRGHLAQREDVRGGLRRGDGVTVERREPSQEELKLGLGCLGQAERTRPALLVNHQAWLVLQRA